MTTKSPVYTSVEKVLDLFDLTDKIELYSYRDDFSKLWELDASLHEKKPIWCVVDDSFGQFHWLPVGVWGHYYRAKQKGWVPKLLLVGEKDSLNPRSDREALFIPYFYTDPCVKGVSFDGTALYKKTEGIENATFLSSFYKASDDLLYIQNIIDGENNRTEAETEFSPESQQIEGWKGIIRNTLSLPEKRHRISNEIASIELRRAIEVLLDGSQKEKTLLADSDKSVIKQFLGELKLDSEKKALLDIWKWVSAFDVRTGVANINKYRMQDIWNTWANGHFLLIDDQGVSNGFDKIVKCALALMMNKNYADVNLASSASMDMSIDDLIKNYDCLFLDLRLRKEDQESRNYTELSGVKIAKEIAEKCPAFPVIIFSSSQQREIDRYFSGYGNIISSFRKPGIAGSIQALDGNEALNNLFATIIRAFEIMENRLVYDNIPVSKSCTITYKNNLNQPKEKKIDINRRDFLELFRQVFWFGRHDIAFTYPYSLFEVIFNKDKLKWMEQIGIKSNNEIVEVTNGSLTDKASNFASVKSFSPTKIEKIDGSALTPADVDIEQWTPNLNLNLRVLSQLRNLYSHGIRDYDAMRREAIVALLLFFSILSGEKGSQQAFDDVSQLELKNSFPLIFLCRNSDTKRYIREVFSLASYYGKSSIYKNMHALRVRNP